MGRIRVFALTALGFALIAAGYVMDAHGYDSLWSLDAETFGIAGYVSLILAVLKAIDLRSDTSITRH